MDSRKEEKSKIKLKYMMLILTSMSLVVRLSRSSEV